MEHGKFDVPRHNHFNSLSTLTMRDQSSKDKRGLVAKKDLSQGQMIFTESPFVCAPSDLRNQNEFPSCLGCCRSTDKLKKCSQCGWPVCLKGPKCEKVSQHAENECAYFKSNGIKYPQKKMNIMRMKFLHKAIMVLRVLLMRQRASKLFDEFMKLPAKTNDEYEKLAKTHDQYVSRVLRDTFEAGSLLTQDLDDEVISKILDRFSLYGYRKSLNNDSPKLEGQVELVYHQASSISRCCDPNVIASIGPGPDFMLQLTAARIIKKNEKLTLPWRHDLYSLGTLKRQEFILSVTGSRCMCSRCKDPTEFHSYLSAVKCSKCQNEYVLPNDPTKPIATLLCQDTHCPGRVVPSKNYERVDKLYSDSLDLMSSLECTEPGDIGKLESWIKELRQQDFLHPNHFVIFRLVWYLVRMKVHYLHLLHSEDLNEFISSCEYLLEIEMSLNPVYSQERAELHFYIGRAFWTMFEIFHSPDTPEADLLSILNKIMELYAWARKVFDANNRKKDYSLVSRDMYDVMTFIKKLPQNTA